MKHYFRVRDLLWHALRLIDRAVPDWDLDPPVSELVFNGATHSVTVPYRSVLCVAFIAEDARGCVVFFDCECNPLVGYWLVTGCATPHVVEIENVIADVPWEIVGVKHIWPVQRRHSKPILDLPFVRLVRLDPVMQ
jgi:hypothetical protein